MKQLILKSNVSKDNEDFSSRCRELFDRNSIFCVNLIGYPGSGKTTIIEMILKIVKIHFNIAVILGDLYTSKDGEKIERVDTKVSSVQINTGGGTYLDGHMIYKAIEHIDMKELDLIIIENIGSNHYPNKYNLGEDIKIAIVSVCEGSDKVWKYPHIFKNADVVILNKIDLMLNVNFNKEEFYNEISYINKDVKVIETSCIDGRGLMELSNYLIENIREKKLRNSPI